MRRRNRYAITAAFVCMLSLLPADKLFADHSESNEIRRLIEEKRHVQMNIEHLTKEIKRAGENELLDLYEARGDEFMKMEEYGSALDDYSKALSLAQGPSRGSLLLKEVWAAVGNEDYKLALDCARRTAMANYSRPDAYPTLALVLAGSNDDKVRDPKAALNAAKTAEGQLRPGHSRQMVNAALAAAFSVNGDFDRAAEYQQKVIDEAGKNTTRGMKSQLEAYKSRQEFRFPRKRMK
jgi:tetratricopeptide (TPR) repeat protein